MKILKAVLLGLLLWVLVFVEISITMIGLKLSEINVWLIHYIALIPFTILCAWLYYKKKDKTNGFLLGLVILIIGIILDIIITVPLFIMPQDGGYQDYFLNVYLLIGFIELIVITSVYDLIRKR